MAPNRRRIEREMFARMKNEIVDQDGNIPTDEEVATIKALLALPHRTEEDWCVIKDIFDRRDLICMEPAEETSDTEVIEHFMIKDGRLCAFTNLQDAVDYIKENVPKDRNGLSFQIGTRPFLEAVEIADDQSMELLIDLPTKERTTEKYMSYKDGQLTAVMPIKSAMNTALRRLMKLSKDARREVNDER